MYDVEKTSTEKNLFKIYKWHLDEVDDKLYAFEQLYLEIPNEHAPLKQTIVRGNQVPYMAEQWRKAKSTETNYDGYL